MTNCSDRLNGSLSDVPQQAVVVIDVLRAFSTACVAFQRGVKELYLAQGGEEAFEIRERLKKANRSTVLIGEKGGHPIPGFDFGNSPSALLCQTLGPTGIFTSTNGVREMLSCGQGDLIFGASFRNARTTIGLLRQLEIRDVRFIPSDPRGEEDIACADYMKKLLSGVEADGSEYLLRARSCSRASDFDGSNPVSFPPKDFLVCMQEDERAPALLANVCSNGGSMVLVNGIREPSV